MYLQDCSLVLRFIDLVRLICSIEYITFLALHSFWFPPDLQISHFGSRHFGIGVMICPLMVSDSFVPCFSMTLTFKPKLSTCLSILVLSKLSGVAGIIIYESYFPSILYQSFLWTVSVVGGFYLFLSAMPGISGLQSFLCFIEFNCFATVFQSLVHLNRISSAKSQSVPWEPPQPLIRFPVHILKD